MTRCVHPDVAPAPSGGAARTVLRRSRTARWRALVLLLVHVAIAAHIAHWLAAGETLAPLEPSEGIQFAAQGILNPGLIFFLAAILLTAVFGRFFCGWGCHVVALQDACSWLLRKLGLRPRPFHSRLLAIVPAVAFVYMFLWPFVQRWMRGLGWAFEGTHLTKVAFWETFPPWPIALVTFFVCGFVIVYLLGGKGFCTYGCPYGGIFGVVDRFAPVRIRVTDACEGCGHCTASCSSNVVVHREVAQHGMVVDPGCMKCLDCVSVCPKQALYVGFGRPPGLEAPLTASSARPKPDFTWGEELVMGGAFVLALFSFRGLYGLVPFLLALGIAAIVAFFTVHLWRLARRPYLRLQGLTLKSGGELRPAGVAYCAGFGIFVLLWAHSGWVQYHSAALAAYEPRLHELRARVFAADSEVPVEADRRGIFRALGHARSLERWSLVSDRRETETRVWLEYLSGEEAPLEEWLDAEVTRVGGARPLLERGRFRAAADRADAARGDLERAVELEPELVEAWLRLALLEVEEGRPDVADRVYLRALEAAGEDPRLLFDHGVLLAGLGGARGAAGRIAEAERLFEASRLRFARAVELAPDDVRARENLAGILCQIGRFREGIAEFRAALQRRPADAGTWHLLARAHLSLTPPEIAEARRALEEGLTHVPGDCDLLRLLREVCVALGDEEGVRAAERGLAGC